MASAWDDFTNLTNFQKAWEKVASNRGCAGVDGETISHFAQASDRYLASLQKALITGQYRPLPLRQILIPKKQGGWRTLGIPTVRDRIVQQAMLFILHRILDPQFEDNSFAYRPGRSHLMAVDQVRYWHHHGYNWVLDADIVKFFDSVHHQRLFAEVEERMHQPDFLKLIEEWVSIGVLTSDGLIFPGKGLPQGSVVSPILANTYLDDFDEQCQDHGLKLVRFADDFIILGRSQAQMFTLQKQIQAWLTAIHLQLHPDKTRVASFQQGFRFLGHAFCRDVIVPVQKAIDDPERSIPKIEHPYRLIHQDQSTSPTTLEQALVEALRQYRQPIPPPLFVVLGYEIRPQTSIKISSREVAWKPDMASLYLVQQGSKLSKEKGRFIVEAPKDRRVEIPIRELETILVFGTIHLTPTVISTCLHEQIPVIYLSQLGDYKGHLWSAEHRNIAVELAQFRCLDDAAFRLSISKSILRGKLLNSRQLLLRLNRKRKIPDITETIANLSTDITNLESCTTLDAARGYEGIAAARYFKALGQLFVNRDFHFEKRLRRPSPDPVNAMLSFGYTLLFNNVLSLLLAEGLHPYMGNLHRSERNEPHLAFDFMEEFRSPIVDSLLMQLINRQEIKPTDFTWPNREGSVYLEKTAKRVFLNQFEKRMNVATSHPDVESQVSYRRAIQLQIQRYKHCLFDEQRCYEPFLRAV